MRTPVKWIKILNENKLTSEMLYYCIYSLNKRAKNCRDKKMNIEDMLEIHILKNINQKWKIIIRKKII